MAEGQKESVRQSCFQRLKVWFIQLSFWKKIIIIFTLNTVILLILTDAIMLVLFQKISNDIIATSNSQKEQFNALSNDQIVSATSRMILSLFDFYSNLMAQLISSYAFFTQNPTLFTSLESSNPQNPQLVSSFNQTSFKQVGYYAYSNQSTFVPLPFIDEMIPFLITEAYYEIRVKRLNVYVQSTTNPDDLSVRTFPAKNTFTVPSSTEIAQRFYGVAEGTYNVTLPYTDSLTTNQNKTVLTALRTIIPGGSYNIMMEIEMFGWSFGQTLSQPYYFPSAYTVMVAKSGNSFVYYSDVPSNSISQNISSYYQLGNNRITVNLGNNSDETITYVSSTVGLSSVYQLGKNSMISNSSSDIIRCMVIVNAAEIEAPANAIQSFLGTESNILTGIVLSWSFVILLSTVALATVVGNYIFYNLKMLSTKMDEYIRDPGKFHKIVIELKELELKGILKRLSDNLIAIIEKIEVRKKERKDRINQNYHPLSVGEPKFQERQQLNDYQILEKIKAQVRSRVEELKKEEATKEKAQKEEKQQTELLLLNKLSQPPKLNLKKQQ